MIRVAVVDDHVLFAEGMMTALGSVPDIIVAAAFPSGRALLQQLPDLEVDILLLDLEMPDGSGLEVLRAIAGSPRAIVISMHTGQEQQQDAFRLGARGFLSKSTPLSDLAAAIRAVHEGVVLDLDATTLSEQLEGYREARLDAGAASLTKREREILRMMAGGITATDELADALFISQKTVKNHLANIYDKLAISDRAQAAIEAIRLGLDRE